MRSLQYSFFKPISPAFGGGMQKGKRKTFRPLNPKSTVHLVLKSSRAKGVWSLLHKRNKTMVLDLMNALAKQNGIRVYRFANVGNHLHILIQMRTRDGFQKFLRVFSGRVAMMVTQARKGKPQGKFWDELAFTRIVSWGKDFNRLCRYFIKNELESFGLSHFLSRELAVKGFVLESG